MFQENAFLNVVRNIATILFSPQYVKMHDLEHLFHNDACIIGSDWCRVGAKPFHESIFHFIQMTPENN